MPPNAKSYIMMATSRGLGTSRVPVMATARSQSRISRIGKPAPSAKALTPVRSRRRWRARAGASPSAAGCSAASGSACSLKTIPDRSHELLGDDVGEVGRLADLLVLEHQLGVGAGALHEHVVDLPGELDVRHRELDRLLLLAELLHRHLDDDRRVGHGIVDGLAMHVDDELY